MMKDNLNVQKDYSILQKKCYSCQSSEHFSKDCPLINFIPNKNLIIKKKQFSSKRINSKKKFIRNNFKFETLMKNKLLKIFLNEFTQAGHVKITSLYFQILLIFNKILIN